MADTVPYPIRTPFLSASFDPATATLTLRGELDAGSAALLDVFGQVPREPTKPVTVSLRHLSGIDSAGVAALLRLCARLRRIGANPRVVNALPAVARTCRRSGAEHLLSTPDERPPSVRRRDALLQARRARASAGWRMALAARRADVAIRRIERGAQPT